MASTPWLIGLVLSVPAIWLCIALDAAVKRYWQDQSTGQGLRFLMNTDDLIRLSLGIWFSWLWLLPSPIWLTPELTVQSPSLQWAQLGLAALCLSRRTAWLTGIGILALWAGAARQYGVYHLMDYPLFLGFAAVLIGGSLQNTSLSRLAIPGWIERNRNSILVASMAWTLMWAAIEKWAFDNWSLPLLCARPSLTMGMAPEVFLALSGWFEFGAAAMLLLGGAAASRVCAMVLLFIFASAVLEFGRVDLVGHFPIIVAFLVTLQHGNGKIGAMINLADKSMLRRALWLPISYADPLLLTNIDYICGWTISYGNHISGPDLMEFRMAKMMLIALVTAFVMLTAMAASIVMARNETKPG